jgi:thiol-disulfide isomerase/thioredoxin
VELRQKNAPFCNNKKYPVAGRPLWNRSAPSTRSSSTFSRPLLAAFKYLQIGAPVRGSPEAAVTIVEFSNFECPFCKQAQLTIMQLLERYDARLSSFIAISPWIPFTHRLGALRSRSGKFLGFS